MSVAKCYKCGAQGHVGGECTVASELPSPADTKVEELPGGSILREVYGDLMSSPDSLCHCVSECLAMGAGIAVLFKQGFGRVEELKAQGVKVGGVAVLDIAAPSERPPPRVTDECVEILPKPSISPSAAAVAGTVASMAAPRRFAYYLVTKPRYFHKPSYGTLSQSLSAMFDHMSKHGVNKISMPELGCGLDGLEWPKVRAMVADHIIGKGIEVTVYHYKPAVRLSARNGNFARGRGQ